MRVERMEMRRIVDCMVGWVKVVDMGWVGLEWRIGYEGWRFGTV